MKLSDVIETYIREIIDENVVVELKRSELANRFHCVPSQINYVIATRFIPELGFYVESRRGGGGYIRITRSDVTHSDYMVTILEKIGRTMSQSVADVYLDEFIRYNVLDQKAGVLIRAILSDKSLCKVDNLARDEVRADMFKNFIVNLI